MDQDLQYLEPTGVSLATTLTPLTTARWRSNLNNLMAELVSTTFMLRILRLLQEWYLVRS
jgi:hypothetical protein